MIKIKEWFKKAWLKTKLWFIGLLASIGIIVGAYAVPQGFTWTNPTERMDGSPYDALTEQKEVRFYCDGDISPTFIDNDGDTSAVNDFSFGSHSCYATVVDNFDQESDPSNTVTFTITPARPNPPVLSIN